MAGSARNVTIKDLAQELGLSITTISRALNGYSDVGEKTRRRVAEAARRFGYRPNRNAQRLVTRRTHALGWIQADNDRKFVDPHFMESMAGVLRGGRMGNYDIMLTSATPDQELATYDRYVRDGSVDGFIVDLPRPDDPRIAFLMEAGLPFVVHGREGRCADYGWVDIDNYGNFRNLARLAIENGHTRFAFINGDEQFTFASDRRRGVETALRELGLPPDTALILNGAHPMGESGYHLTEQALEDKRITAILYSSTLMAIQGQAVLTRAGLRIGTDMMIATMDDDLRYFSLLSHDGTITFVRSSLHDAGTAVVEKLIAQCEHGARPTGTVIPSHFELADGLSAATLDPGLDLHRRKV